MVLYTFDINTHVIRTSDRWPIYRNESENAKSGKIYQANRYLCWWGYDNEIDKFIEVLIKDLEEKKVKKTQMYQYEMDKYNALIEKLKKGDKS